MWTKIVVFNFEECLGSFYTNDSSKESIIQDINVKFGKGNWTNYSFGNQPTL